ncbi:type I-F CRISPR-associated protein Csy2 [Pseudothauera lacus]|uniref:Type I-F CRISPR-associated protein Csy2 n=1 Tax=Pseudothauera lacus TaxID=2136175 RepID=A0A2T4IIP3_9RHOO|nr:type I-F CRISPR-associated protein Csy2 [Pseudothauera lacus]PTD97641.1 type I-F CRISPR-associated protein Csy2 [Pseudothauera lacus]
MNTLPNSDGLLILPRLRVQNANAISSPLTHGFPSMTAFLGLMWALARKLEAHDLPLAFDSVGVICHDFDEQVTEGGYVKAFRLTRNPVGKDGGSAAIVEEGRMHMEITLIFGISGGFVELDDRAHDAIAQTVAHELAGMRIAGGSVLPSSDWRSRPAVLRFGDDAEDVRRRFRHLRRHWLPGFALVCRDDLLHARLDQLREAAPETTALDALLDLSRFNWRPVGPDAESDGASATTAKVEWKPEPRPGWIVPIPVGFGALSELMPAGEVQSARDRNTPFRFVESVYSIGQWISPHRLDNAAQLLWYASTDPAAGLYRCRNDFASRLSA